MTKNPNRKPAKDIGTRGETGVVRALQACGLTEALRPALVGADVGDVHTFDAIWQVKAGKLGQRSSEEQVRGWMLQAQNQADNAGARFGFLVTARTGYAANRAEFWWCWMRTGDAIDLICPTHSANANRFLLDYPIRYPLHIVANHLATRFGRPDRVAGSNASR